MYANELVGDKNWASADSCSLVNFGDCVRVDLRWNDGAYAYHLVDTMEEANKIANSLGFYLPI